MPRYRVLWEETFEAESHRQAAEYADAYQRRTGPGQPKTFEVIDDHGEFKPIALDPPAPDPEQAELEASYRTVLMEAYDGDDEVQLDELSDVEVVDTGAWVTLRRFVSDYEAGVEAYDE